MLPSPLHPAVVHFPIVFTFLLPVTIGAVLWLARGQPDRRRWALPLLTAAALAVSSWAALESGEAQEDRVEDVVAEAPVQDHEQAANLFMLGSLAVLGLAAGGLLRGRPGALARGAAFLGSLALVGVGYQVGHTGGSLVYEHGAASAFVQDVAGREDAQRPAPHRSREAEEHDR